MSAIIAGTTTDMLGRGQFPPDTVAYLSGGLFVTDPDDDVIVPVGRPAGPRGLMNHSAYVLEYRLAPSRNSDAQRIYYRRRDPVTNRKQVVHCRVSQLSSREALINALRGAEVTHRVYFVDNPQLREENRLEINGLQYILMGVPTNASQVNRLWQIDVRMITQQNENHWIIE